MIDCPFCHTPLAETAPSCPRCNLDLQRTRSLLGPIPRLSPSGLTDLSQVLSAADEKSIRRTTTAFHRRFPQCRILIIIKEFPPQFPLGVHLFWLFNTAGLSGEEQRNGRNRDILLGLDPTAHLAGLIVGYGLEPFLPQPALEHALDKASPDLKAGDFANGLTTIIRQLSELMEGTCRDLPTILGLDQNLVVETSPKNDY